MEYEQAESALDLVRKRRLKRKRRKWKFQVALFATWVALTILSSVIFRCEFVHMSLYARWCFWNIFCDVISCKIRMFLHMFLLFLQEINLISHKAIQNCAVRGNGTGLNCVTWRPRSMRWVSWSMGSLKLWDRLYDLYVSSVCFLMFALFIVDFLCFFYFSFFGCSLQLVCSQFSSFRFAKHAFSSSTWSWLQWQLPTWLRWVNTPACFVMVLESKKWSPKRARSKKKKLSRHTAHLGLEVVE